VASTELSHRVSIDFAMAVVSLFIDDEAPLHSPHHCITPLMIGVNSNKSITPLISSMIALHHLCQQQRFH